jgi:hypothetical protein
VKLAALILAALAVGFVVFCQHEEIRALRGQRDRALAACNAEE